MVALYLNSEKVGPNGGVTSQGVLNQLGRPKLDPLAVLVREAVQNSWDARSSSKSPVELDYPITFGVKGWTLTDHQRYILQQGIFAELPPDDYLPLRKVLESNNDLRAIVIYDRGTTGLGGPTRADEPTQVGESRDFVDFLRNVGQPPDKKFAGGTYGYGKAAFYRVSHSQTILVHTKCKYKGKVESRFIASALGYPYNTSNGIPYTGRHWWGRNVKDVDIAEPILGEYADKVAEQLGMPSYGDDLGTTIMILQPFLEEIDPAENEIIRTPWKAMNVIAENILLYFWPKMLKYDRSTPSIQFHVTWENQEIILPQPENYPPLTGYVNAMYRLKGKDAEGIFPYRIEQIESLRPHQFLGNLALEKFAVENDTFFDTGRQSEFQKLTHHTALMRQPELVVKYLSGPVSSNPRFGYGGVFITDKEVDPIFAEAEPPTHDDWVADSLADNWHQRYVRVSQNRIGSFMEAFGKPSEVKSNPKELTPLGAFSNVLGTSLLSSIPGNSASTPFSKKYKTPMHAGELVARPATGSRTEVGSANGNKDQNGKTFLERLANRFARDTQPESESTDVSSPLPAAPQYEPPISGPLSHVASDISDIPLFAGTGTPPYKDEQVFSNTNSVSNQRKIIGSSKVKTNPETAFVSVDNQPALQVQFSIIHGKNAVGTNVTAEISAIIDGSAVETDPPLGASKAEVIRWIDPEDGMYAGSSSIFIASDSVGVWKAIISLPEDMMIDVSFSVKAMGDK